MEKRIQIPARLYEQMVSYIDNHYDPRDSSRYAAIQHGIEQKLQLKRTTKNTEQKSQKMQS